MASLSNLPNIPSDALREHEDGRLVLFCGAGISVPSGIPGFGALTLDVAKRHSPLTGPEESALKSEQYDRFLHLLEGRVGQAPMRQPIITALGTATPSPLHSWLIDLAKGRDGQYRIVTTNFDTLLEEAADDKGVSLRVQSGPRLGPVHPAQWDSLVHLHGVLDVNADPIGRELVLTSGDFGRAYLTERWASKFVADLFANYSVLFIGYSASDPVMRYLLDAFAVRKLRSAGDRSFEPRFYALEHFKHTKSTGKDCKSTVEEGWTTKGVIPILYLYGGRGATHPRLNARIGRWAQAYRGGQSTKTYAAKRILDAGPSNLDAESQSELSWILSDDTGVPIGNAFLDPGGDPRGNASTVWLDTLDRLRIPSGGNALGQAFGLAGDWQHPLPPRYAPLVANGPTATGVTLEPRARALAGWMAVSAVTETPPAGGLEAPSKSLLNWVIEKGGAINHELLEMVRGQLRVCPVADTDLLATWELVTNRGLNAALQPPLAHDDLPIEGLGLAEWSDSCVDTLMLCIRPLIRIKKPFMSHSRVDISVELRCAHDLSLVEDAMAQTPNLDRKLSRIANASQSLLEEALRLQHSHVPSFTVAESIQYPRIGGLGADWDYSWTFLPDLVSSCGLAFSRTAGNQALALFERWVTSDYPTMNRLAMHAARTWKILSAGDKARAFLNG